MNKQRKPETDARTLNPQVLQIRRIGNSTGVILPKDLLAKLGLKEGDKLNIVEAAGGVLQLSPYDPKFTAVMELARKGMKKYRNALAELAK